MQTLKHNFLVILIAIFMLAAAGAWAVTVYYVARDMSNLNLAGLVMAFTPSLALLLIALGVAHEGWRTPSAFCGCGCR